MQAERKHLSPASLIDSASQIFSSIKDPQTRSKYSIKDCLLSGLALFGMKYSSLLQMDEELKDETLAHNLHKLYKINTIPSDTHLRVRLDNIDYARLQYVLDSFISQLQRAKLLMDYRSLDDSYLVSIDGTGYFSSNTIHCEDCCVKHSHGQTKYYHQVLSAVLVHPDLKQVFPLAIEQIIKQDGNVKNDCERNAAFRLLRKLRTSHPHLKMVVVLDALYANGPLIKLLQELDFRYIITAKNLEYLFDAHYYGANPIKHSLVRADKISEFEYGLNLPLNATCPEVQVNLLRYKESAPAAYANDWITDILINKDNMHQLMKCGRARWKIENETFNTLKNHGYHFEHNYGHGYKNLSIVLCYLMFIAFAIDQVQEYCGYHFKRYAELMYARRALWERLRAVFIMLKFDDWESLYVFLYDKYSKLKQPKLNTS